MREGRYRQRTDAAAAGGNFDCEYGFKICSLAQLFGIGTLQRAVGAPIRSHCGYRYSAMGWDAVQFNSTVTQAHSQPQGPHAAQTMALSDPARQQTRGRSTTTYAKGREVFE